MSDSMIALAKKRLQQIRKRITWPKFKIKGLKFKKIAKKLTRLVPKTIGKWERRVGWFGLGAIGTIVVGVAVVYGGWLFFYRDKIYPGVSVGGVKVEGLNLTKAAQELQGKADKWEVEAWPLIVVETGNDRQRQWQITQEQVGFNYEIEKSLETAFAVGRQGSLSERIREQWVGLKRGIALPYFFSYDQGLWENTVATIAAEVNMPAIPPALEIVKTEGEKEVVIKPGEAGQEVDNEALRQTWEQRVGYLNADEISLTVKEISSEISEEDAKRTQEVAKKFLDKKLTLTYADEATRETQQWGLTDEDLLSFLSFKDHFEEEKVAAYVGEIAKTLDRPAQNALLQFDEGKNRVVAFQPAKDGVAVDQEELKQKFLVALEQLEQEDAVKPVQIEVKRSKPAVTNDEVNNLGINELIGRGVSTYYGSIPNRVFNVGLTAQRLNGAVVKPGETFSFNATIGEVSATTGYKQAYVIRSGRTELDDGGGVCQVSTTTFRAALDAGLPIVERRAHAYRVGYYEQNDKPGLDATVYAPRVDLKFKNDTPGHLLIQAQANAGSRTLVIEVYGTSDGRVSEITNHKVWDVTPPPPDLYQDDPTLPAGTVKQVDWKAWGAKVKFDYIVRRGGEVIYEKTFYSYFKPWQAVFLRGTGG